MRAIYGHATDGGNDDDWWCHDGDIVGVVMTLTGVEGFGLCIWMMVFLFVCCFVL
jgi:hypothetical protein